MGLGFELCSIKQTSIDRHKMMQKKKNESNKLLNKIEAFSA